MQQLSALEKLSFLFHMHIQKHNNDISFWHWLHDNNIEPTENSLNNFYSFIKRKHSSENIRG